jgi:serine protease Do
MEDIQLLEVVEKYLNGEMTQEEKTYFEQLRQSSPEVDQMVVEHAIFLNQLTNFASKKNFRHSLQEAHHRLQEEGAIKEEVPAVKVVSMFRKYRKVLAVAASIAGIIALTTSGLVTYFAPRTNDPQVEKLVNKINQQEKTLKVLSSQISSSSKAPVNTPAKTNGTGFLLDNKGYLITNAHVIKNDKTIAKTIIVQNNKGQEFKVKIAQVDDARDLAVLKIDDEDFKTVAPLPYALKKTGTDLGEPVFTMGFPRNEIVYGEGYMSAKTGFNGDTLSCQIAIAANPGNSGGPVFNKNGEVVGILSTRQLQAQGFVFAVTTRNILRSLEELKKDTAYSNLKIASNSSLKGMERTQQVKKIEEFVFLVKTY